MSETGVMPAERARAGVVASVRRKFALFVALAFVAGMVAGCLLGIYGFRHFFMHLRPRPETIATERAQRIQKDFGLGDDVGQKIYEENIRHFEQIRADFSERHKRMDELMKRYADAIAGFIEDPAKKDRWLSTYREYFPKRPPPPPPLGGFPPGHGKNGGLPR